MSELSTELQLRSVMPFDTSSAFMDSPFHGFFLHKILFIRIVLTYADKKKLHGVHLYHSAPENVSFSGLWY